MKFYIIQNFKVLVYPNKLNTIVKEDSEFEYENNTTIDETSGIKYDVLKKIYDGDLLKDVEYQIFASLPIFSKNPQSDDAQYLTTQAFEITEFSQLEGLNPIQYPFLIVQE